MIRAVAGLLILATAADVVGATPEVTGGDLVGTLGAGFYVVPSVLSSLGVSYDNNQAILIHPGLTVIYSFL